MNNSKNILNQLLHEHPVITVFGSVLAIDMMPESDTVIHRFHHMSLNGESLTFFTRAMPMKVYFSLSEEVLCTYYVQLFQDAHKEFKLAEIGEE